MKYLIILLFVFSSVIPIEVLHAMDKGPANHNIPLELRQITQRDGKYVQSDALSLDIEKGAFLSGGKVGHYRPILDDADVDFIEEELVDIGYVSKEEMTSLGKITGSEFGSRCDYVLNSGIKRLNQENPFKVFSRLVLLKNLGFKSQGELESSCGPDGENCLCDPGYSCQETDKLNSLIGNVEFQDRAGQVCLFRRECEKGDTSPHKFCEESEYNHCIKYSKTESEEEKNKLCATEALSKCQGEEQKCFYSDKCLVVVSSKKEIKEKKFGEGIMACEDDYNCASGYCKKFSKKMAKIITGADIGAIKLCAKPAECRPLCTTVGGVLKNPAEDFCCEGSIAYDDGTQTKCIDPAEFVSAGPPMFKVKVNPVTCEGGFFEDSYVDEKGEMKSSFESMGLGSSSGNADYSESYYSWSEKDKMAFSETKARRFYRVLRGIEYLWGRADSAGVNDTFGVNSNIVSLGEKFRMANEQVDRKMLEVHNYLKHAQDELESDLSTQSESNISENAAGVSTIQMLANYHQGLSGVYSIQSHFLYNILGMDYNPMDYSGSSSDPNYKFSFEESYNRLFGTSTSNSDWPKEFEENSFSGLFYKTRQPVSAGVTGNYYHFGKFESEGLFSDIDLPCEDQFGEPIKAKDSDWFGDRKTNEVCVKEMSRVYDRETGKWIELVNPIYPTGLLGEKENLTKYTNNPTHFPLVKRFVIDQEKLIENINDGLTDYSQEKISAGSCTEINRVIDGVSDNELMMLIKLGAKKNLPDDDVKEAIKQARDIYGDNWRQLMADELTKKYVYQSLTGTYQNQYVRDGFDWGDTLNFGSFLVAGLVFLGTFGGVNLFNIDDNKQISQKVAAIFYEFLPFEIEKSNERFNKWGDGCSNQACHDRKYLNSVSNESATEISSYTFLLDGIFYLESYAKAKQVFHQEVSVCLNNIAKNYSEAYGVSYYQNKLSSEETVMGESSKLSKTCHQYPNDGHANYGDRLEGYEKELGSSDIQIEETVMLDKIPTTPQLELPTGSIKPINVGVSDSGSDMVFDDGESEKASLAELKKSLKDRNEAVKKLKKNKSKMLNLLTKGRFSDSIRKKHEAEYLAASLKSSSIGEALKNKVGYQARNIDIGKQQQEILESPILEGQRNNEFSRASRNNEYAGGSRNRSYASSRTDSVLNDQNRLASHVKRNKNKIRISEEDQIWKKISKAYMLHGVPRLFKFR